MKKALKMIAIVGGVIVMKEAFTMAFNAGMGYVMGVANANNEEQVTVEDVVDELLKNGFSWRKTGYYSGVLAGEREKKLGKEFFGN